MRDFIRDEIKRFGRLSEKRDSEGERLIPDPAISLRDQEDLSGNIFQFPANHGIFLADHPLALLSAPLALLIYL